MHVEVLLTTARRATLEVRCGQPWQARDGHVFELDGQPVLRSPDNVVTLDGLEPERSYRLAVFSGGQRQLLNLHTTAEPWRLDVRDFGAFGDGVHDDTAALQAALSACPAGGTVVIGAGTFLSGPLFIAGDTHLHLARDAVLLGHPAIDRWPLLPAQVAAADGARPRVLGSWEGRPAACHASLLNVLGGQRVLIDGDGCIDANASFETWWSRPKAPFAGWRPRAILLAHAREVAIEGIAVRNAPSWTVHALRSRELLFARLRISAPPDSPNTDGIDPESCERVRIAGCRIDTGDDCVAIKSGKPGPDGVPPPTRQVDISNCLMESGHGAVVIGSETAGGVYDVRAVDCLFRGTDRGLRIKTRRGRGRAAIVDGVHLENVRMDGVGTPLSINSFYWCDPDGREPHVGDRRARPVDDGTPSLRRISLRNVQCTGVAHAAAHVLGLPEQPIEDLRIDGLSVRYEALAQPGHPDMAEGIAAVARAGAHFENVRGLVLDRLDIEGADGPELVRENAT